MPYLLGLFYWGACRLSKLGATSIQKGCKIDRIEWEMCVISIFWLSFCDCMHEYPRPIHCTESSETLGGLRQCQKVSFQTLFSQESSNMVFPSKCHYICVISDFGPANGILLSLICVLTSNMQLVPQVKKRWRLKMTSKVIPTSS